MPKSSRNVPSSKMSQYRPESMSHQPRTSARPVRKDCMDSIHAVGLDVECGIITARSHVEQLAATYRSLPEL